MATHQTSKAKQTRELILDAALALILDKGYEKTTMRAIAKRARLSLGAAYYYFPTKEHIIQAFYERTYEVFISEAQRVLDRETALGARLAGVIKAQFQTASPFHSVSRALFKAAADPSSPLSPLSRESKSLRERCMRLFEEAVHGSVKLSSAWGPNLPVLLWLMHLGFVAFWIFDQSPGQSKTFKLVDTAVPLAVTGIKIASSSVLRPFLQQATKLFAQFELFNSAENTQSASANRAVVGGAQ